MTLEQILSPQVEEWFRNYNSRLNEGKQQNQTNEEFQKEFENWFIEHEDEINESVKNMSLNEGVFDFDDDDDEDESGESTEPTRKTEIIDDDTDDEKSSAAEDSKTTPEEEVEIEHTFSRDPRAKHRVDNSKNSKRNIFKVVNVLYDKITREGKNMDKKTYLSILDTSDVNDMTALLAFTNLPNADLSGWDTSGVRHMEGMFYKSTFNNDSICNWNVSSCADFKNMFLGSKFNQSLSKWKTKMLKVKEIVYDDTTGERRVEEVDKRAPLPFVGAYEDEEKEMDAAFWDDKLKGFEESKKSKYTHFMDFESFMLNEGLLDKTKNFIKKGVDKVKDFFNSIALKLNDWYVSFIENGQPVPAVSPYTTLNYISTGKVDGVSAFTHVKNDLLNDNVIETPELMGDRGYYENISKDSNEYKNFETFVQMLEESKNKNVFDVLVEEGDRVGLSGESGGIKGIRDINSKKLKEYIRYQMLSTPGDVGNNALKPILIWGAPGVGKSSIPNAIIAEYNADQSEDAKKKSLVVAECGDMTPDGFALPMPNRMSMTDYISSRPHAKKLAKEMGISDEELENSIVVRSSDAPKMWLPCYKPDPDKKINELRKKIANGWVREYYDDNNDYHIEETCDGGILMFDEFFRADPSIFKILMQILLNRKYGDYVLGDKWAIIACSNRPNDDEEVAQSFERTGAVVTTRFDAQYNFIPDFSDWKKWAETKGGFDEMTLEFLVSREDNGEYIYWHSIDPEMHTEGYTGHPTPRSWSALMNKLNRICKIKKYTSIADIPTDELEDHVYGAIGEEVGKKYIDFIKNGESKSLNVGKILNDASYVIPDPIPSAAELSEKITSYMKSHYSKDELPSEEVLLNMFNLINKTYSKAHDNYFKMMHINIIKMFINKQTNKETCSTK